MDRFGIILVRACYVVAGLAVAYPLVLILFDWNDPGHVKRLCVCLPLALVIAVLGKMLDCLLKIAKEDGDVVHEK